MFSYLLIQNFTLIDQPQAEISITDLAAEISFLFWFCILYSSFFLQISLEVAQWAALVCHNQPIWYSFTNRANSTCRHCIQSPSPKWAKKTKFFPRRSGCGPGRGMKVSGCMQDPKIYLHAKY